MCDEDKTKLYLETFVSISAKWKAYHTGSDSFVPKLTLVVFYQRDQMAMKKIEDRILIHPLSHVFIPVFGQPVT